MGDVVHLPPRTDHLRVVANRDPIAAAPRSDDRRISRAWEMRLLSEADNHLHAAGLEVSDSLKSLLQGIDLRVLVTDETVESVLSALIAILSLNTMSDRDRALYAAARHWLSTGEGGDRV